jgi:hypothetical protein
MSLLMSPCGRIGPIIFGSEKEKKLRDRDRKSGCSKGLSEVNAEYKRGEPVEQQNPWKRELVYNDELTATKQGA